MVNKELCDCGKTAVWLYMPGYSNNSNPFRCDDCVGRGCSCNWRHMSNEGEEPPTDEDKPWKWVVKPKDDISGEIKEGQCWKRLEEKGREYPCVEYDYSEEGYDKD